MKILKISLIVLAALALLYVAYIIMFKKKEEALKADAVKGNSLVKDKIKNAVIVAPKSDIASSLNLHPVFTEEVITPGGGIGEQVSFV